MTLRDNRLKGRNYRVKCLILGRWRVIMNSWTCIAYTICRDVDASYVRAVNKKSQVEHANEDYIKALVRKQNKIQEDEDDDIVDDLDIGEEIRKRKLNILGDDLEGSDTKKLQQVNTKLLMRLKETS